MNENELTMTCSLASPVIPVTGLPRLVYAMVEIKGAEGGASLPVNLGLVIDTSESMRIRLVTEEQFVELANHGNAQEVVTDGIPTWQISTVPEEMVRQLPRRIDYVLDSLVIVGERLRPPDNYSVVAFAKDAASMVSTTSGKERERLFQTARELEYLNLGDGTQMAAGLKLAFEEVQRGNTASHASRLIVLTDGYTQNVQECYAWARRAQETGVAITTMGIGSEFNEELLIPLADMTGGRAYFIETPEHLPEAFREELGTALGIRYRNLRIELHVSEGVELRQAHRVLPELGNLNYEQEGKRDYHLFLGHYDNFAPPTLLLAFAIPPWTAGNFRLAKLALSWNDPAGGPVRPNQPVDVPIQLAQNLTVPFNASVMKIVEKVGAYKLGTAALASAESGDQQTASERLRRAAARLLEMGETILGDELMRQAKFIQERGGMDPKITKRLRYETRRLTQQLNL